MKINAHSQPHSDTSPYTNLAIRTKFPYNICWSMCIWIKQIFRKLKTELQILKEVLKFVDSQIDNKMQNLRPSSLYLWPNSDSFMNSNQMVSHKGQHILPFLRLLHTILHCIVNPLSLFHVLCNLMKKNKLTISDRDIYPKLKQIFKSGIDPLIHSPIQKCCSV